METGTLMISASRPWDDDYEYEKSDPYADLAAAIIIQAVTDYTGLLRWTWKAQEDSKRQQELILEMTEVEDFFYSDWFSTLCDYDPDKVIQGCRMRAKEQEEEAIRKKNRKLAKEAVNKLHTQVQEKEDGTDEAGKNAGGDARRTEEAEQGKT